MHASLILKSQKGLHSLLEPFLYPWQLFWLFVLAFLASISASLSFAFPNMSSVENKCVPMF